MKKKILALLLAVVMLVGVLPLSAVEYNRDIDGDGEYFVLKASDATITKEDTTVDVNIDILDNTGVYSMKFFVIYDKELTLVNNSNITVGSAFENLVAGDVGTKDSDVETLNTKDKDWRKMINKTFADKTGNKYYAGYEVDTEDVLVSTLYTECEEWDEYSTGTGTLCTFTFQIDPNNTKDEFKVQILPVHGNIFRVDEDNPKADDEGFVEIFDAIGLTGTITIEGDEPGPGPGPGPEPVYTEPTIYVSNAEILEGTASADFTVNLVNNPGIFSVYGFISYDDAMSLTGFDFGTVFAENEFSLGNPLDVPTQLNLPADNALVKETYKANGLSPEGLLSTQIFTEGSSFLKNNENNGVLASFTLDTSALTEGEYDIMFVCNPDSTINVDFDNVEFDVVYGKLTVVGCYHNYEEADTVLPTCDAKGYTNFVCSLCGETKQENFVDALGHDYDTVVTDPTCEADGFTTYTCSVCGHSYEDDYTDMIDHNYVPVVTDPTCTEGGFTTYTCSMCGDNYVADETEATGHDWTVTGTSGTCGETGKTDFECTVCGDTKTEEGAVIQHNYEETAKTEPTCTEDGESTTTCTICGDVKVVPIPTPGHDYAAVVTEPTCTEAGLTTYTCSVCGDSYTEEIPAPGHNYDAAVTAPTCTEQGFTTYTCSACGDSYVDDEVAALGHDYEAVVTDPTCEEYGYTTYTCSVCGDSYVDDEVAALGHLDEAVVTAPTCTEQGFTTYTCTRCGDSYKADYVDALGHDYEETVTEPTCTEKGFTTHTCTVCGDTYDDTLVDALGHDEVVVVTDPTCTEAGNKNTTCTRCDLNEDEAIEALGHDLVDSDVVDATCTEKGSKHEACTRCDYEADVEIEALGHKWNNGKVTKEPTVDAEGEKTYTCEVCEETKVEKLEKLPAEEKEESKEESKEEDKSHQTGDNVMMFVFVALIAVVSVAGVMFSKKKLFANK